MSNMDSARAHSNWKRTKSFTLEEAASNAIKSQTVRDFRYLKALDEAHFAIKAAVDHFADRKDGSKSIDSVKSAPAITLLRHALRILEGNEDAEGN